MRWRGGRGGLGHSFFSSEPRKRKEVMILYCGMEEYMRRGMVDWLPPISHHGGERQFRMKSFRFGGGSLFDIVSALAP
jgi:hypothetical protein